MIKKKKKSLIAASCPQPPISRLISAGQKPGRGRLAPHPASCKVATSSSPRPAPPRPGKPRTQRPATVQLEGSHACLLPLAAYHELLTVCLSSTGQCCPCLPQDTVAMANNARASQGGRCAVCSKARKGVCLNVLKVTWLLPVLVIYFSDLVRSGIPI